VSMVAAAEAQDLKPGVVGLTISELEPWLSALSALSGTVGHCRALSGTLSALSDDIMSGIFDAEVYGTCQHCRMAVYGPLSACRPCRHCRPVDLSARAAVPMCERC
jgi:hypothetical protein